MESEIVRLVKLLRGFALNQIIATATRQDIPSFVSGAARSPDELVEFTGLPWDRLEMIMIVIADLGIVARDQDGRYRATSMTELLTRESGRLYGLALMSGDEYYRVWEKLDYSLDSGKSAFHELYGMSMWEYFDANPAVGTLFSRTMGAGSELAAPTLLGAFDFTPYRRIVDIGAGDGSLVAAILERYPDLKACVLELPGQVRHVTENLARRGLADRCEVVGGDMFRDLPDGGDVYIFKGVLHNWPDDAIATILGHAHTHLPPGGKVLVVERAMPPADKVTIDKAINTLTMTLLFGTTDRTVDGYDRLLHDSGFRTRILDGAGSGLDMIEATKG